MNTNTTAVYCPLPYYGESCAELGVVNFPTVHYVLEAIPSALAVAALTDACRIFSQLAAFTEYQIPMSERRPTKKWWKTCTAGARR